MEFLNKPQLIEHSKSDWAINSAIHIQKRIEKILVTRGSCSVMLTGGKSASSLYQKWGQLLSFKGLQNVNFYLSDERCVSTNHPDSNIGMIRKILFANGVPSSCNVYSVPYDSQSSANSVRFYEGLIPDAIDVTILGIGMDGHIASIFPLDVSTMRGAQKVVRIKSLNHPHERITVTPLVINASRNLFLIAYGAQKANALLTTLKMDDPIKWPACLALRGEWLLDDELFSEIRKGLFA